MTQSEASRRTRRASRPGNAVRLVRGLVIIALLSAGVIGGVLWWEDRPLRSIEQALERKEFAKALEMADRYLRESPDQARVLDQKARALAGLGRWSEAERLFTLYGVASPASQRAWAEALLHEERWTEALPLLLELSREFPNDGDVLHELAACQGQLGYFDESIQAAARLSKIPEHERRGRLLRGMLEYRRRNNRLAIEAWKPLIENGARLDDLQTTPGELLLAYGQALLDDGRPADATLQLERAVEADATDAALLALAESRDSLGDRSGSVDLWRKVVGRSPDNRDAREGLARAALERQAPIEALEWLEPLLERDDLRSSTMHLAQRGATLSGDKATAAKWERRAVELRDRERKTSALEQAMRESPRSFWSRCIRAHRFASDGNRQQALILAEELLAQKPDEPFIQQLTDALRNQKPLPPLDLIPLTQH